jgi:dihydroflavonol-4-reductase
MGDTVLLTGASGYIAKHIARALVDSGYEVRGTVRRPERGEEVREAVRPHLSDPASADERLTFAIADLDDDSGWDDAVAGVDAILHTASPFPIAVPKDEASVIRPAVDGTLRVLRAARAAGVRRMVLTSSAAAIVHTELRPGRDTFDEDDWTDLDHRTATAYTRSKTMAERAAWGFVADDAPDIELTAVNPGFVLGPPLAAEDGASMAFMIRLLSGKDPMLPKHGVPVVDVRDVADMHLRALQRPETAGRRYLGSAGSMWFSDMAKVLKSAYPDRKIATRDAPHLLMRMLSIVDREVRSIVPSLGMIERVSNERARTELDMTFIPPEQTLLDGADFLVTNGLV